ncbi:MAG: nucleotidyl transferase AbiEii/AbiGii toxin family protein [Saprospiraceae bacterium]|nr:nucleotidyl transferase AbiEii/AbiGii toxin family protein [Saprospiraceae bacterium]
MLQSATVHPATLAILKKIMSMPTFQQFNLVGGTSLSLQIGHRISIDLDLFSNQDFNNAVIIQALESLGELIVLVDNPPFLQLRLNDVKLDFLKYPYPFVQDYREIEGVRLVSIENIGTMKLTAIARRGAKKDFFDIYFLLERFTLAQLIEHFEQTLPHVDPFHIIKSLTYFDDADKELNPEMLIKVSWQTVKKTIEKKVEAYLKQIN